MNPTPSAAVLTTNTPVPVVVNQEQVAHMRRRLFRTLDQPDRPIIAIDCGSVTMDVLGSMTQKFLDDVDFRDSHNLVLAIPKGSSFVDSPAFDCIQNVKHSAFENGYDGKLSWLLIDEPDVELAALENLVTRQGGKWCASV